ncbi:MAG: MATE family efflux transporter [Thomasclavelia sp.]
MYKRHKTTDTYFAGKLTDNAIAGISVTNIIMNIFISFFTSISIGTTAVVSRNYGKKDYSKTNQPQSSVYYCWNNTRVNCKIVLSDFS